MEFLLFISVLGILGCSSRKRIFFSLAKKSCILEIVVASSLTLKHNFSGRLQINVLIAMVLYRNFMGNFQEKQNILFIAD